MRSRKVARRRSVFPSALAKILAAAVLALGLFVVGSGADRIAGAVAAPTSIPAALSSAQSGGSARIVVKLAPGAHLISNGVALPDEKLGSLGSHSGVDRVSELVTARGHMLDLARHGLHQDAAIGVLGVQVLELPDQADTGAVLAQLRLDEGVVWAEESLPVYACAVPNDPYYSREWALPKVGLPAAWNATTGSGSVTIAVVDTGLYGSNADFAGRIVSPYSLVGGSWSDTYGHGTAVAGVAASQGDNGVGIAGAAWGVKIMPVKISASGSSDYATLSQGVVYAVDNGADVINISFGGPSSSLTMQSAINYALSHGVVVVASAGNSGPANGLSYPAAYAGVISVGATDAADTVAYFSSTGSSLVLSAPGVSIYTWNPAVGASTLQYWNGTSFSSPLVAGIAALMLSVNPNLTPAQVTALLEQTALDLGTSGPDQYYGHGRVRADAAVAAAAALVTPTPPPITPPGTSARYEQTDPMLYYAGSWTSASGSSYSGGSYKYANASGASVSVAFNGTAISYIARKSSSQGLAELVLDGTLVYSVDLYSSTTRYKQTVWSSPTLDPGDHTLVIRWTGTHAGGSGTTINLDALDIAGTLITAPRPPVLTRYEQTDPLLYYAGSWTSASSSSYSGRSYKYTNAPGASVSVAFNGTAISYIARKSSSQGLAELVLDGTLVYSVDLYSSTTRYKQTVWSSPTLDSGDHTLVIKWTGTHAGGSGTTINLDALDIMGTLIAVSP